MKLNPNFINIFSDITSKAAIASLPYVGLGDKNKADNAAVKIMRKCLNELDIKGRIVIGEGELDEAPMLYIGEKVGTKNGPELDIALDPLEGTNFTAKNLPNAFSVLAVANKNCLLSAPDTYMNKIVIGSYLPENLVDLDNSVEKNIKLLAEAKNKKTSDLSACVLKRPRHDEIVETLNKLEVKINFITDGDIAGALSVIGEKPKNDIYLGIGGGPEGVLTAAALSCYGGQIQGRLILDKDEKARASKLGVIDFNKKYNLTDMVKGDVMFCATGVTSGDLARGVKDLGNKFEVYSFALHKDAKVIKNISNIYNK